MCKKHHTTITPEVADILRRSAISGSTLKLPQQLERKAYQAVMKVIDAAGGKWNRKRELHEFPREVSDLFSEALQTGGILNTKKALQAFYTPHEIATRLVSLADVDGMIVLEPSAGHGALADVILDQGAESLQCIEIDPDSAAKLDAKDYGVRLGDFLQMAPIPHFDRVVMNPPFTNAQDIDHVMHAFNFLAPGGILCAITGTGWTFHTTQKAKAFQSFVEKHGQIVETLPTGTFRESGTDVATLIIRLQN